MFVSKRLCRVTILGVQNHDYYPKTIRSSKIVKIFAFLYKRKVSIYISVMNRRFAVWVDFIVPLRGKSPVL